MLLEITVYVHVIGVPKEMGLEANHLQQPKLTLQSVFVFFFVMSFLMKHNQFGVKCDEKIASL